jgi:hypothetical protein
MSQNHTLARPWRELKGTTSMKCIAAVLLALIMGANALAMLFAGHWW